MKKVYQTIVDINHGNCMQAAYASLFDLELNDVPNFIEYDNWLDVLFKFFKKMEYTYDGTLYNPNRSKLTNNDDIVSVEYRFDELKKMKGVNGYFYAVVLSPKYYDKSKKFYDQVTHAVVVDKNLNIVHDPNYNYKNLTNYPESDVIEYNGIISVNMINKISDE